MYFQSILPLPQCARERDYIDRIPHSRYVVSATSVGFRLRLHFAVAILDAGRNALSFFLLLVVSLGLSVVRESLGKTMIKCQLLAVAHFIFGGKLLP